MGDQFVWDLVSGSGTLAALFHMLWIFFIKCLLISLYFTLIYAGIRRLPKTGVRANYYRWYGLSLSVVLANLGFNDIFIGLSYRAAYASPRVYAACCLLSVMWLLAVLFNLTRHIALNRRIQSSLKRMAPYDDGARLAERAALAAGLRAKPRVLVSDDIQSPASCGVFQKTVILPANGGYSPGELYLLLLHEAAHIKNGDTVKLYFVNLIRCFLWVTPAMRLFVKRFKRDSEILCDNRVMGIQDNRDTYGGLILRACIDKNAALFGFSDSYHAIEGRLDALYRHKPGKNGRLAPVGAVTALALLASCAWHGISPGPVSINRGYNSAFQIVVAGPDVSSYEVLDASLCAGVYEVRGDEIRVDKLALRELAGAFEDKEEIYISSDDFVVGINGFTVSGAGGWHFYYDELDDEGESGRYFTERVPKRPAAEYLFLLIADLL